MRATRALRTRLHWAGTAFLVAPGERGHRLAMARTATYLWAAGAALDLAAVALPGHPGRHEGVLVALAAVGLVVAGLHLAAFDRLPAAGFQATAALGSTLIAIGTVASREPAFAVLYLLVVVFAFFFFAPRAAFVHAGYALCLHAAALGALGHGPRAAGGLLLLAGTALVTGLAVALARARLRALVDRLRAEARRLEQSQRRFADVVQSLDAIVWEAEVDPIRSTFVSAGAEKILGYPARSWLEEEGFWERHLHPEDRERVLAESARHAREGTDHVLDYRMVAADGRAVRFRDVVRAVNGGSGTSLFRGVMIDVTERSALEEELRQSHKLNAVGRLAGGVAHDLNNVLMAIHGSAELLEEGGGPDAAERIRVAAARGASLTQQLLAFSRRQLLRPVRLRLNDVVDDLDDMLRRLIAKDVLLERSLDPRLGWVEADPIQMQQVLMNLVLNARDAVAGGDGRIEIRTSELSAPRPLVRSHGTIPAGDWVVLEVADTGCGMDAETQAQAFEPFFTTKPPGEGTGLGLSTVYGIVRQSGGHVAVETAPGRGTTVQVLLPRREAGPARPDLEGGHAPAAAAGRAPCSVLLVDDDELVRGVVREALLEGGYGVVEAASGEQALELCDTLRPALGAVVTDVVMPGMGGRELVANLEARYPSLKVLFVSGYDDDALGNGRALDPSLAFLQKPFTLADLRAKLAGLLSAA